MTRGTGMSAARRLVDGAYNWIMERVDRIVMPIVDASLHAYVRTAPYRLAALVEEGISRGLEYFDAQPSLTFDAAAMVTLTVNTSFEPRLARLHDKVRAYARQWNDPHLRLLDASYDPDRPGSTDAAPFDVEVLDDVEKPLLPCLYADRLRLDETFLPTLEAIDDGGGYGTTHKLLGGVILKRFSTIPAGRLDALIDSAIPLIARAQRYACATDIFSERTMLLLWFGHAHLVRPSWIVRILRAQAKDGGWRWRRSLWPQPSDQHPTALALAALILFRETYFRSAAGASAASPSTMGDCFPLAGQAGLAAGADKGTPKRPSS